MELKYSQLVALNAALHALDGKAQVVRENNANKVVVEPYDIDADTLLLLAINGNRVSAALEDYGVASNALLRKHLPAGKSELKPDMPEFNAYQSDVETLQQTASDVKLLKIELSKLKVDTNKLVASLISALLPVLKYEAPAGEETVAQG